MGETRFSERTMVRIPVKWLSTDFAEWVDLVFKMATQHTSGKKKMLADYVTQYNIVGDITAVHWFILL